MVHHKASPALAALGSTRLLLMLILGAGLVILAFLAVLSGSWWALVAAMVVLLATAFVVVRKVLSILGDVDAP
jgi:hypothetical protein